MEEKKRFIERMEGQLQDWEQRLDHLKVQANLGKLEARERGRELIERLERQVADGRKRLDRARESGEGAWKDVAGGIEKAWEDLRHGVQEASRRFQKKG